jgi:hypothetical protein
MLCSTVTLDQHISIDISLSMKDRELVVHTVEEDESNIRSRFFFPGPIKFVLEPYNGSLPRLVRNPYSWTQVMY